MKGLTTLRRVHGYAGEAREITQWSEEPVGEVEKPADLKTPYSFGQTLPVFRHENGDLVCMAEIAHRRFMVFKVDPWAVKPVEE